MSNKDLARVVLGLAADVRGLKRDMDKADKTVEGSTRKMQRATERAAKGMDTAMTRASARIGRLGHSAFTGFARGAALALAPVLSIGAALNTARSAMSDFNKIADKSNMLGLSAERLQELRFAAEQSGMAVDNFDTAFRRFVRRASEAAQGTGAAKSAFEELGISLTNSSGRLKDTDALLGEVANALQRVPQHADKLRLAFKMFDTDGAMMVSVLADGAAGLDEFARKARDLGIIIDNDVIARAADMQTEFDTATKVLDLQFKQVLIDLAPLLVDMAQFAANVAGGIRMITDAVKELMKEGPGAGFGGNQPWSELLTPDQMNAMRLRLRLGNKPGENLYEGFNFGSDGNMVLAPPALPPGDSSTTRNEAAKAALRQAEAVARIVENLQHEQAQLGRTAEQQELYNLLKAAGVERESEYGQAIEAALGPLQDQRAAIEANAEAMRLFEDAASSAMQTFIDDLIAGKDAGEALGNVLKNLGSQLISMGIQGLTRNLGGMLFPGFDAGGYTGHGGKHQPAGIVHRGEYVFSKEATQRAGVGNLDAMHKRLKGYSGGGFVAPAMPSMPTMPSMPRIAPAGGSGDNVTISMPITIDATGADLAAVARIHQSVEQLKAELPGRVQQVVRDRGRKWK